MDRLGGYGIEGESNSRLAGSQGIEGERCLAG